MRIAYTIVIHIFYFLMVVAARFNNKAALWVNGRKNWRRDLNGINTRNRPVFWFHAASLGEFEQGLPVMEALRSEIPGCSIIISFFSPSGYEIRKNYSNADHVFYLPLDTRYNARDLVRILKPDVVFFIKYEFWYYYLNELKLMDIPVYLLSGIFRPQQIFFKWYGFWFRQQLHLFSHFFVQDHKSASLLKSAGIRNYSVTGDTRFDRVARNAMIAREFPVIGRFVSGSVCVVAGSTWPADETLLIGYINRSPLTVKFIIAPHEIDEPHIKRLLKSINKKVILYSLSGPELVHDMQVLIIDNIGMLSSVYRYGQVAYIGGGFGKGIHNLLEAAVYNIPVIFGPNYHKFREAFELIEAGGGFSVANENEFRTLLDKLLVRDDDYTHAAERAGNYIESNRGSSLKVIAHVTSDLKLKNRL